MPLCRNGWKGLGTKEIQAMKQTKELDGLAGTVESGGDGSDNSRPMVARIKEHVNYYYSTSI